VAMWVSKVGGSYHGVSVSRIFFLRFSSIWMTYYGCRTCFWAGDTFAPRLKIKDKEGREVPVQQFLQGAFLDMCEVLVRAVGDLEGVLGFEVRPSIFIRFWWGFIDEHRDHCIVAYERTP
jgi:hypothetical protein